MYKFGSQSKPRIAADKQPRRTSSLKWWCTSVRSDGVEVNGSGYTPEDAYAKWLRNAANPDGPNYGRHFEKRPYARRFDSGTDSWHWKN